MHTVDLVVPCYNEEEVLPTFYKETRAVTDTCTGYSFRFLFVDDGSRDRTAAAVKRLASVNDDVHYLSFTGNFGKEAAMYAGLFYSTGDYVIIMDADLQHPPALIPEMIKGIEEGHDCVAALRTTRAGESKIRSFFSHLFFRISNGMSDVKIPYGAVDYRMMTRQMVDSVLKLPENSRFSKGIFLWVGYDTKWIPYENVRRTIGKTKWSFRSLLKYAVDGITSFSVMPLHIVSGMGFFICVAAFIYIIATLIQTLVFGITVPGYVTTLCAVLFLGGIIELSIGILGEYIARIYTEVKHRPIFLVRDTDLADPDNNRQTGTEKNPCQHPHS